MKRKITLLKTLLISAGMITITPFAHAESWYLNATGSATEGAYSGSALRDRLSEQGIRLSADYLEQGGITTAYSHTRISMKNGVQATEQNNLLLSGRLNFRPDALPGRFTVRLDGHRITNNDATRNTNDVSVIAPQLSWLSKSETLYADLGYADSRYQNQLSVRQYTPTLGIGLNGGSDWVQLRGYLISGMNPTRAAGKSSTSAIDTKWTHYFAPRSALIPTSATLGVTAGERIYAVDMDAQSVANLADLDKGGASLGLGWNVNKHTKVFALVGQTKFRNEALGNDYRLNVGHASLSIDW
jgi:hypothetical protein